MSNKFEIQVVALDKATAVFRKVNTSLAQTFRPVTRLQKQVGALGKELHLDKMTKGMKGLSAASAKVAQSLGLSTAPLEALFGLGAAGGIVAATAAVAGLGAKWGATGYEINRTATAIGVSTDQLQEFRGVARLAGISTETATASLANMARTMQDAEFGRNPAAFQVLNQFGIGIKRNAAGVVDGVATYKALADVLQNNTNPQVRELIANTLGIDTQMLPLLIKGSKGFNDLADAVKKTGIIMGPQATAEAKEYGDALNLLKLQVEGLAMAWASKLTPAMTAGIKLASSRLSDGGAWELLTKGLGDLFSGRTTLGALSGSRPPQAATGAASSAPTTTGGRLPLGLRLHNPGNLRIPGSATGFQSFDSDEAGLARMAQQIAIYGNRDGLRSISGIVNKYAPSSENNTSAYIAQVAKDTGFDPGAQLNTNDPKVLAPLLSSMVKHEQGRQPFGADDYAKAAQTVKVEVAFANAPPGTQAKANAAGGPPVPARVSYSLPMSDAP